MHNNKPADLSDAQGIKTSHHNGWANPRDEISKGQVHPLKQLLLSDLMQYSGTRVIIVILLILIFSGPLGWAAIGTISELGLSFVRLHFEPDSLRNYRMVPSATDLVNCRDESCTYDTLPAVSNAKQTFDTALLLPPPQRFDAPEGKVFTHITMGTENIPYIDGISGGAKKLAEIVPIERSTPLTQEQEIKPAECCSPFEVASPGIVVAVQPEEMSQSPIQMDGNLAAWKEYLSDKTNLDELRFSRIVFQPIPHEWRFAIPQEEAKLMKNGDQVTLDFEPDAIGHEYLRVFKGKISNIDKEAELAVIEVTPNDDSTSKRWLGVRISAELSQTKKDLKRSAVPEKIRFTTTSASGEGAELVKVPLSALETQDIQHYKQARVWIIVENFLVPIELKVHNSNSTYALVEECPITAALPISNTTWEGLTNWQRSRLLTVSGWGKKSLLLDKNNIIVASPKAGLRSGAPARPRVLASAGT